MNDTAAVSDASASCLTYREFMQERYGCALFRVPVDLGAGCPHRAEDGTGGCAFCPPDGARAVQTREAVTVEEQVEQAISFARRRYRATRFMLYLQAYSHTLSAGSQQRRLLLNILDRYRFEAVSIGMRPDSLEPNVLAFLADMNRSVETWVELGVQTVHNRTLKRINRGHTWQTSLKAVYALREYGLHTILHVIIGLPGEEAAEVLRTAETLAHLPFEGIKIHDLHVVRGTALASDYAKTRFPVLDEHAYAELLIEFLRRIPPEIAIMRMTTDTPPGDLIAPRRWMAKGQFVEFVDRQMRLRGVCQGDLVSSSPEGATPVAKVMRPISTRDGSPTFWSDTFKEHYHTPAGAGLEAVCKYVEPSRLRTRLKQGEVRLLDVCFGLGYNTLEACAEAARTRQHFLDVTALEINRHVVANAAAYMTETRPFSRRDVLTRLFRKDLVRRRYFSVRLLWGDARNTVRQLKPRSFDVIYLDPFSTQRNSELWTVEFFSMLKGLMGPAGVLLTYSNAVPVLAGLLEAGFHVGQTHPGHGLRAGTIAALRATDIAVPLTARHMFTIRETPRGTPYRDPHVCWTNRTILHDREQRMRMSSTAPAPAPGGCGEV
jgi:radical SAM protein (TIGR01212 family)